MNRDRMDLVIEQFSRSFAVWSSRNKALFFNELGGIPLPELEHISRELHADVTLTANGKWALNILANPDILLNLTED